MNAEVEPKFKVTIGADPEFFVGQSSQKVEGKASKFTPVMACGLFGGTKGEPVLMTPDGGYLEDGTAIEINVTPSETLAQCRKKVLDLLLVFQNKHPGYEISGLSSAKFTKAAIKAEPKAMQIGCAPDLWVYGARKAPQIEDFKDYRFAGGHIHLGIDPWPEGLTREAAIKMMDIVVFLKGGQLHYDEHRYPHYGYPGLYRETRYGIEYRTPSNRLFNPSCGEAFDAQIETQVTHFDTFIGKMKMLLEAEGHGATLQDFITSQFLRYGLEDYFVDDTTGPENILRMGGWADSFLDRFNEQVNKIVKGPPKNTTAEDDFATRLLKKKGPLFRAIRNNDIRR